MSKKKPAGAGEQTENKAGGYVNAQLESEMREEYFSLLGSRDSENEKPKDASTSLGLNSNLTAAFVITNHSCIQKALSVKITGCHTRPERATQYD